MCSKGWRAPSGVSAMPARHLCQTRGGGYQPVWESNPAPTKTLNVYNVIHFIITDIQLVGLDQGRTQFGDSRIIKTLEASLWREQDGQDFYNQQTVTGEEEMEQ